MFNSDEAQKIYNFWNQFRCCDFYYVDETLYQSRQGFYFLVIRGWCDFEDCMQANFRGREMSLIELTREQALIWLLRYAPYSFVDYLKNNGLTGV